jgi:hypothetical protein
VSPHYLEELILRAGLTPNLHPGSTFVSQIIFSAAPVASRRRQPGSGPERQTDPPVEVNGEFRESERVPWWEEYGGPLAVFGYSW